MSAFVSHDGDGTEVYVSIATAKVTSIDEKNNSVNVIFKASYLEHPLNGWLNTSEESLEILRKAKEDDKEVEVRIEAQRKPKVDKSIPIQDIREGRSAKTDIIKKIASVNGVFSSEALTNPEDDPATGRPKSALGRAPGAKPQSGNAAPANSVNKDSVLGLLKNLSINRGVSETVLDALKAQALLSGATALEVEAATTVEDNQPQQQNGFSREAPPYKEFNNDGRLNLGGASIAAGVGVYNYVFDKLSQQFEGDPMEDSVEYLSALILSIADVIQVGVYGKGFRPDRSAGSHVRARACLFGVIDHNPLPVNFPGTIASDAVVNAWVKKVGATARQNFITGITLSQQFPSVKDLLSFITPEGLQEAPAESVSKPVETPAAVVAPETFSKPVEAHTEAPVAMSEPTVDEIVQEPTPVTPKSTETYDVGTETQNPAPKEAVPPVKETVAPKEAVVPETMEAPSSKPQTAVETKETVVADDGLIRFEQRLLPPGAINSSNSPSEEILEQFKEFVIEETGLKNKSEQAKVSKLLSATFGRAYNKATNIPEDDLADFLDFYVSTGVENFKAVLDSL